MELHCLMGDRDAKTSRAIVREMLREHAEERGVALGPITTGIRRPDDGPVHAVAWADIKPPPEPK